METIDQKVKKVLEREKNKQTDKNFDNKVYISNPIDESIKPEYTLSPKDTIGKSIYFNTVRR